LNDGYSPQPFDSRETEIALGALVVAPGDTDPRAGFISVSGASVLLDESSHQNPFRALSRGRAAKSSTQTAGSDPESETAIDNMFSEDMAQTSVSPSYSVTRIRRRNTKAANTLKKLYKHTCQITGTDFLFKKRDGTYYTEVHHLIPLGEGGADNPRNMVVLSPQLHKMLHHATVDPIDLSQMKRAADGRWYLEININQTSYRIHWLPAHAKVIQAADQ
jgi:5-methylcytosine-specific restriction protein A